MSPIPRFDHNNALPPHLGDPRDKSHLSPYQCTILELCHSLATTRDRIDILKGYIKFRIRMTQMGIIYGFQWIDGSFLENIEVSENRSPKDLDVVTFFGGSTAINHANIMASFPEFGNPDLSKLNYHLDHYPVDYTFRPDVTVEFTRYWIQLFTHKRNGVWKGILRLPLNTDIDDKHGLAFLDGL